MAAPNPLPDDAASTPTDATPKESVSKQAGATRWRDAAEVVHYEDAPDECTIYPTDVEEWELMTTWISAQEGSYVPLAAMR